MTIALDRTAYDALVNDDSSNTVGTPWDKDRIKTVILDPVDAALALTERKVLATSVTGAQNNYAPALAGDTTDYWSGASDAAVTGLAGGVAGQRYTFKNVGTNVATFAHQSGSSAAGNRFRNFATSAATPVAPRGSATWEYDGTDWRILQHEQGAPIAWTPTVTGSTSASGQAYSLQSATYVLRGSLVLIHGILSLSTLGTITGSVRIGGLPFPIASSPAGSLIIMDGTLSATVVSLVGVPIAGTSQIDLQGRKVAAAARTTFAQADLSATSTIVFGGDYPTT